MCEMYRVPFEGEFKGHSDVAVYELSLVDKLFYRIMRSWIERNLKKAVLPARQVTGQHHNYSCADMTAFSHWFVIELFSLLHREGGSKGQGADQGYRTEEQYCRPCLSAGWQRLHTLEGNRYTHSERTADYDKMYKATDSRKK